MVGWEKLLYAHGAQRLPLPQEVRHKQQGSLALATPSSLHLSATGAAPCVLASGATKSRRKLP